MWCRWSILVAMVALAGCQLPALPQDRDIDNDDQQSDLPDMIIDQFRPLICIPNNRVCQGAAVEVCAEDGRSFSVEPCPIETFCQQGQCLPVTNTCEEGKSFTLSTRDVLFEVRPDLKATDASIVLLNCGDQSLFIRKAAIASPVSLNGTDVFAFDRSSPQGIELPPGTPLEMKIQFRPRRKDWAESGSLFLTIDAGGQVSQRTIELKSQTWCVSTQPRVSLGLVNSTEVHQAKAYVSNCGTMPLTISGVNIETTASATKPERITTNFAKSPEVLVPGQTRAIEFELQRNEPGPLNASASLIIPEQDAIYLNDGQPHNISLDGYVYNGNLPCVDQPAQTPRLIEPLDELVDGQDILRPMAAHVFDLMQPDDQWQAIIEMVSQPTGTPSLHAVQYDLEQFWLLPYWVGAYTIDQTLVHKQSGARACQSDRLTLNAKPTQPLYAELGWEVEGDTIIGDASAGVDLDLHVRITRDGESMPKWGWPQTDCFVPNHILWSWPCETLRAVILGASLHGQYPEVFVLKQDEPVRLDFGIYLKNKSFFPSVQPRLRLWRYGNPVVEFEQNDAQIMSSSSGFLLVGTYDLKTNAAVFLNFPVPYP